MNRPQARNALGKVFVSELSDALDELRLDKSIRVVVFKSGIKGVFCAGADLKEREQMGEAEVAAFVHKLRSLMSQIATFPAPTIAAIDGFALGGGLELALACDLRVAASSAIMGLIETSRGLLPGAGGTQRLPRCVGVSLAKELIFTGRRINGEEAKSIGLVNHAVPQNQEGTAAYHRALEVAREIVPQVMELGGRAWDPPIPSCRHLPPSPYTSATLPVHICHLPRTHRPSPYTCTTLPVHICHPPRTHLPPSPYTSATLPVHMYRP
uniref:Enoyl-CoA hydratase domain containing 2 n=2 Tax=Vombatus ursinus TaxID=29139 RepID=A0A4X2KVX7_VOMUR